jgi:hypothetical protein
MTNTPPSRSGRAGLGLLLALALLGAAPAAQAASAHQQARAAHAHHAQQHVKRLVKPHAIHAALTLNPSGGSAVVTTCSNAGLSAALGSGAGSITFACNPATSGKQMGGKWVITMPQSTSPAFELSSGTLTINGSDGGRNDVALDGGSTSAATGVQILRADDGTALTLMNLTLQNANAQGVTDDGYGGALETLGNFTATNVSFLNNKSAFAGGRSSCRRILRGP